MIKIITLVENTAESKNFGHKHGLSFYIETKNHKILFDFGPNGLLLKNAEKAGVDISDIDTAVLSHGHVDHAGGLKYFLKVNKKAKVYIRPQAVEPHYVKVFGIPFYAGVDARLIKENENRFVFSDDLCKIDDELALFSNVRPYFKLPKSNGNLFALKNGKMKADDFCHEQNLLVFGENKTALFCGCAHAGVVNIVNAAKNLSGAYPAAVAGGFHLFEPAKKKYESDDYIEEVAVRLKESKAALYTCHCTGEKAFEKMKSALGNNLAYLRAGSVCVLNI